MSPLLTIATPVSLLLQVLRSDTASNVSLPSPLKVATAVSCTAAHS